MSKYIREQIDKIKNYQKKILNENKLANITEDNMKNRNLNHSDNWATPKDFYDKLDK